MTQLASRTTLIALAVVTGCVGNLTGNTTGSQADGGGPRPTEPEVDAGSGSVSWSDAALGSADAGSADAGGGGEVDVGPPSGRLMITEARMAELQELVASGAPEWQALLANVDAEMDSLDPYRSGPENIAMVYLMTGDQQYANAAWTWAEHVMNSADVRFDSYLHYGDYMRQVALVFNYCHEGLADAQRAELADYLERWSYELWHDNQGSGWGLSDPGNNYHMAFLEGTAFAGYALREAGRPSGDEYVAILTDKLDRAGGVIDYLATRAVGGDWHEGVNYGQRSKQRLFAALSVVAGAGGTNYFATEPFFAAAIYGAIYQLQPGAAAIYPGGDMTRSASMQVTPYDREYVHAATYWGADPAARGYGQHYLDQIVSSYAGPEFNLRPAYYRDFLFGRDIVPATPQSALPTFYRSPGTEWITSRSNWAADATCLSISGAPIIDQSHAHMDTGSFTIWKNGWLAVDAATFSDSGLPWGADAHNLVHVAGHERRGGAIPGLTAVHDDEYVTYAQVDASNLHRYRPGSGDVETMLNEYTRELVYLKPDHLVVYDRVDPKPSGQGYSWRLHFPVQPSLSDGRYSATYQGGGISLVQLRGGAASVHADTDLTLDTSSAWRVEEAAPADGRFLNVVAVASGAAPALGASEVTSGAEIAGAQVGDQVVVFSRRPHGAAAALPFSYVVADGGVHTHTLVNLGQGVDVTVVRSGATTTITVSPGSHLPDDAGLLRFSDD